MLYSIIDAKYQDLGHEKKIYPCEILNTHIRNPGPAPGGVAKRPRRCRPGIHMGAPTAARGGDGSERLGAGSAVSARVDPQGDALLARNNARIYTDTITIHDN